MAVLIPLAHVGHWLWVLIPATGVDRRRLACPVDARRTPQKARRGL